MRELVLKLLQDMETKRDYLIGNVSGGVFEHSELHQEIGRLNVTHEFVGELKRIIEEDDTHVH
ncbi:hypothetical protein [Bacillus nitratireducens]|uniref:hypothetical protein n=1 Tax=Bacillus nitratireducens TaxID=2026193 RepID=UPI00119E537B|nr:hypothetical protein [Bacillus nitratireducens]